jgi:hypothetical protein
MIFADLAVKMNFALCGFWTLTARSTATVARIHEEVCPLHIHNDVNILQSNFVSFRTVKILYIPDTNISISETERAEKKTAVEDFSYVFLLKTQTTRMFPRTPIGTMNAISNHFKA